MASSNWTKSESPGTRCSWDTQRWVQCSQCSLSLLSQCLDWSIFDFLNVIVGNEYSIMSLWVSLCICMRVYDCVCPCVIAFHDIHIRSLDSDRVGDASHMIVRLQCSYMAVDYSLAAGDTRWYLYQASLGQDHLWYYGHGKVRDRHLCCHGNVESCYHSNKIQHRTETRPAWSWVSELTRTSVIWYLAEFYVESQFTGMQNILNLAV